MSAPPPIVAARRPGPARVAGFAVLLVVVSWSLGTFSAWPWAASDPRAARLRVSLRHVTGFSGVARVRSAEELARLPAHMRPSDATSPATDRRADAMLAVAIDGREVFTRAYRPTGFRRDGPVYAYEELALPPGRHTITVRLSDVGAAPGTRVFALTEELRLEPGEAPLVEFAPAGGWVVVRPGRRG